MSRSERLKDALIRQISDIERGGITHDYQAGFRNGLALVLHHLLGNSGKPRYLYAGLPSAREEKFAEYRDAVVAAALGLHEARIGAAWAEAEAKPEALETAKVAIGNLTLAVEEYNGYLLLMETETCTEKKESPQQSLPLESPPSAQDSGQSSSPSV